MTSERPREFISLSFVCCAPVPQIHSWQRRAFEIKTKLSKVKRINLLCNSVKTQLASCNRVK